MSNTLPFAFALYPLGLSGIALIWLYRASKETHLGWSMRVVASGTVIIFIFLTGSWVFTSYYLRFVVLVLYAGAILVSFPRNRHTESQKTSQLSLQIVLSITVTAAFLVLNSLTVTARYPAGKSLDLAFPLRDGTYYVLQGGSNAITNPVHALSDSQFAIDFVKLNRYGNRARGVAPRQLLDYEIFGDVLHNPCSGTVLTMRDGMPDNEPGTVDAVRTEGNHLIIDCGEAQILMAHLKTGSLLVSTGQKVLEGQPVGRIGNSGNTMEPHLHIEA